MRGYVERTGWLLTFDLHRPAATPSRWLSQNSGDGQSAWQQEKSSELGDKLSQTSSRSRFTLLFLCAGCCRETRIHFVAGEDLLHAHLQSSAALSGLERPTDDALPASFLFQTGFKLNAQTKPNHRHVHHDVYMCLACVMGREVLGREGQWSTMVGDAMEVVSCPELEADTGLEMQESQR